MESAPMRFCIRQKILPQGPLLRGSIVFSTVIAAVLANGVFSRADNHAVPVVDESLSAEMVWVGKADKGNVILYSVLQNDVWSKPATLSEEGRTNLIPAMAAGITGSTFVVWPVAAGDNTSLMYTIVQRGMILADTRKFATGLTTNMAPSLAVDYDGKAWLVWSGNKGTTSDIYYTYWENNRWHAPEKAHPDNDVPDVLPKLKVEPDGTVMVNWSTYTPDGYVTAGKRLKEGKLITPPGTNGNGAAGKMTVSADPLECVKTFPVDGTALAEAVLLSRCQEGGLPQKIRFVGIVN